MRRSACLGTVLSPTPINLVSTPKASGFNLQYPQTPGDPVFLEPNSLYIAVDPALHGRNHWALLVTDEKGTPTRHEWREKKSYNILKDPTIMVIAPCNFTCPNGLQPAEFYTHQKLDTARTTMWGRTILAYFRVLGVDPRNCTDIDGYYKLDEWCRTAFKASYITVGMNRAQGLTSKAWVLKVLDRIEMYGCVKRPGKLFQSHGGLLGDVEEYIDAMIAEYDKAFQKCVDEDKEYVTRLDNI